MYGATFYIKSSDILNKLCEEDKERFNRCIFSNVRRVNNDRLEIDCLFINDQDTVSKESDYYCYKYDDEGEVRLGL